MRILKLGLGGLALMIAAATSGCSTYGSYCEAAMDCMGGNDADIEACEINQDEAEEIASIRDCSAEFDALFACVEEESSCEEIATVEVYTYGNDCENEEEDYNDCMD